MLAEKYSPKKISDIIGQGRAASELVSWYDNWKPGESPAFLVGDAGTGKTSSVKALALEKNLDLIEVNASDKRNPEALKEIIGHSSKQASLFRRGKIILLDEVDGLSGTADRGGAGEIVDIIKESKFPIAMTANDAYDAKLRTLRIASLVIKFSKVHANSIAAKLKEIAKKEGLELDQESAKRLAMISGGDFRAALTDLETLLSGEKTVTKQDLDNLGFREKEQDVFELMKIIFKTSSVKTAIEFAYNTDKDPDEIFWWLEENISNEYERPEEIARAYDWLSRADMMKSKIRKFQNWRFQKYMVDIMCGGVASSKKEMYRKFSRYMPPKRLQMMGASKGSRGRRKEICGILSPIVHASSRKIIANYFSLFRSMIKANRSEELIETFRFTEDDIKILLK